MSTDEFPGVILPLLDQIDQVQNDTTTMQDMSTSSIYHFKPLYGQVGSHDPVLVNFAPNVSQLEAATHLGEDWRNCFPDTHEFLMSVENFNSI